MRDELLIAENERRFVAQELHDHAIQTLLQLNMQIEICRQYFKLGLQEETATELDALEGQIARASQQLRNLMTDLLPPASEDGSFKASLQTILEVHHQRGGPTVHCQYALSTELPHTVELTLLRIIQEGLANIRKHAKANQVTLTIAVRDNRLYFQLKDDGLGFAEISSSDQNGKKKKTGIVSMQTRAKILKGQLKIDSQLNQGTTIKGALPI